MAEVDKTGVINSIQKAIQIFTHEEDIKNPKKMFQ